MSFLGAPVTTGTHEKRAGAPCKFGVYEGSGSTVRLRYSSVTSVPYSNVLRSTKNESGLNGRILSFRHGFAVYKVHRNHAPARVGNVWKRIHMFESALFLAVGSSMPLNNPPLNQKHCVQVGFKTLPINKLFQTGSFE
eukprot:scaffold3043_cov121-Cylindrotheca_fusiformis.AAC.1